MNMRLSQIRNIVLGLLLVAASVLPAWAEEPVVTPPTISASPLIEGKGGHIDLAYAPLADPYNQFYAWTFTITSLDGSLTYTDEYRGGDNRTPPTQIEWNGTSDYLSVARPSVVMPAGDYTITFRIDYAQLVAGAHWYDLPSYLRIDPVSSQLHVAVLPDQPVVGPSPTPTPTAEPTIEPTATPTPTVEPTVTPTPTPTPTPDPAAKLHPVLFIHGLNAYPEMWSSGSSDYVSLLKSWGYPAEYVSLYHYSGTGVGKDGYNNQGDIPEMAAGMSQAVEKLHQASLARGGDGQVDIIAHSMGGLIAREYIKEHPEDNYIGKVIAIGTPFQGSWLMDVYGGTGFLQQQFRSWAISTAGVDPDNLAEKEMTPGSQFLKSLNYMHGNISYFSLYGDIRVRSRIHLFDIALSNTPIQNGDLVVSAESAINVADLLSPSPYSYYDERYVDSVVQKAGFAYTYTITQDSLEQLGKSPYFHINLPGATEVKSRVIKILENE